MRRFTWTVALGLALLASLDSPRDLVACGGPSYADLGPVLPVDHTLQLILTPGADDMNWGNWEREELRFLYPLRQARPNEFGTLWDFAHENAAAPAPPSFTAFEAAVRAGRNRDATREARAIVDQIYALPPVFAATQRKELDRAVEWLELESQVARLPKDLVVAFFTGQSVPDKLPPALAAARQAREALMSSAPPPVKKGHPRAGSLELAALRAEFAGNVPDGFSEAIRKQVSKKTWKNLEKSADAYVKRYANHPLRDEARLWKIRVLYFQGDYVRAWDEAVAVFPDRPVRAAAEMRFLLVQGHPPDPALVDRLKDPVLLTALTSHHTLDAARFDKRWALAETAPSAGWSENLRVRLLAFAARHASAGLPPGFPRDVLKKSVLAGKLRAAALLAAQRYADAEAQVLAIPPDAERDRLYSQLLVSRGEMAKAAELLEVGDDARRYVIRVLASDKELAALTRSKLPKVREDALVESAARAVAQGKWALAARHASLASSGRAKLWKKLGVLAASKQPDRDLELARYLDAHVGELFFDADPGFYRGVSGREEQAPAAEKKKIALALTRSHERWLALEAYTRFLEQNVKDARARAVLSEADRAYSRITNFGGGDAFFFGRHAKHDATIARLRAAGAKIRKLNP